MRLLWYGETPNIETGAGQVAKHLLPLFLQTYDYVKLVAINQWWVSSHNHSNFSLVPCQQDDLLNLKQIKLAMNEYGDYDVMFLTADMNRLTDLAEEIRLARSAGKFVIMYAAMDCEIYARPFLEVLLLADVPVVYSEWEKRLISKVLPEIANQVEVVYHGSEPEVFYPLAEEERKAARREIFGIHDDTFLVINVNRNQVRKDLTRTMAAFHLFHQEHPHSLLYLHAKQQDFGGNLPTQAAYLGLRISGHKPEIVFSPAEYHESAGVSREDLNRIYNAADCFITSSTGEGWGLTTSEAMAAARPIIAPDNTVFSELLGENERGILVESGGPDLWVVFYGETDTPRMLASTTGLAAALTKTYTMPALARIRGRRAREWTKLHTWAHVEDQWRELLCHSREVTVSRR